MFAILRYSLATVTVFLSVLVCIPSAYMYWFEKTQHYSAQGMGGFLEFLVYLLSLPVALVVCSSSFALGCIAVGSDRFMYVFAAVLSSIPCVSFAILLIDSVLTPR